MLGVTCSIWLLPCRLLGRGEAAVDGQDLTGDERRGGGGEEEDGPDEIARLADSAERDPADEARP